jgi:hypothetical protein
MGDSLSGDSIGDNLARSLPVIASEAALNPSPLRSIMLTLKSGWLTWLNRLIADLGDPRERSDELLSSLVTVGFVASLEPEIWSIESVVAMDGVRLVTP